MVMRSTRPFILLAAALLASTVACSDNTAPGDGTTKPISDLTLVRIAPPSPPLLNAEESFYAVQGEDREVRIYFDDLAGGEEFLRLRVRPASLQAHPDGSPI